MSLIPAPLNSSGSTYPVGAISKKIANLSGHINLCFIFCFFCFFLEGGGGLS